MEGDDILTIPGRVAPTIFWDRGTLIPVWIWIILVWGVSSNVLVVCRAVLKLWLMNRWIAKARTFLTLAKRQIFLFQSLLWDWQSSKIWRERLDNLLLRLYLKFCDSDRSSMSRSGNLMYADDELASLRPISAGGNRVVTPSKVFKQIRSGSNPRSSSATKDSRALYRAIHEIDTAVRAPSRATSRSVLWWMMKCFFFFFIKSSQFT